MPLIKAIITDYIGTLTNVRRYTMDASIAKLHQALVDAGFPTTKQEFLQAYEKAHEKYRIIRYEELREITNAVWVTETLWTCGFDVTSEDKRLKTALDIFFQDYINSLELRPCAKKLLKKIGEKHKLGLVSNFTYAPVVYESLQKLGISSYFDAIVVSGDNGWRKPHKNIFTCILQKLKVEAKEAIFLGDSPKEDIKGAADTGMRTVFVPSQFNSLKDLEASGEKPFFIGKDLEDIYKNLNEITNQYTN